jgi:hypothetical protein
MRSGWLASRTLRVGLVAAVIAGYLPLATAGCFGNFALTRKVYDYNEDASRDKWMRWLVFLALNVIPVYAFATVFDSLFANSVEFWTGENPVTSDAAPGTERVVHGPNGEVGRTVVVAPGVVDLDVTDGEGVRHELRLVREDDAVAAYDREGRFLMRVGDHDGVAAVLARAAD